MERYVLIEGTSAENIDYGACNPMEILLCLCVDDGVPDRGHRTNIFNPVFKKMACFTGDHKVYEKQTVINYNGDISEMDAFMREEAEFGQPPQRCTRWTT